MRKAAVSARGLGSNFLSNRLLLLNDGRPETDPWAGIFYPDETTPMTNLKQIEVIRGPGSALYGSNAFSGVINLIQRGPDDLMRGGRPYGVDFRVLGGQNNTYRLQTTAAGKVGDLKGLINYYGTTSDGPDVLSNPRLGIVDKNEGTTVNQVTSKVVYKGAGVDVGYTHSIIGRPGGMNITTVGNCGRCHYTPRDSEKIETFYLSGHADEKVGDRIRIYAEIYANFKRRLVELEDQVSHELRPVLGKRRRVGGAKLVLFLTLRHSVSP